MDIFSNHHECIINTDIDGIFSGLILHNVLGWDVVGFCDSNEKVWLDEKKCTNLSDAVYIDMFVHPPDVKCIDQHIVAVDEEHAKILAANSNKLNPNLMNIRTFIPFDSYKLKYPFGTVHFIIAMLEKSKKKPYISLEKQVIDNVFLKDIILRADDAMVTTIDSNYTQNASDWWKWLNTLSDNGTITSSFSEYLYSLKASTPEVCHSKKKAIADFLMNGKYHCQSPDGGYKHSIDDSSGILLSHVKEYINDMADFSGLNCFNLDFNFSHFKGKAKRIGLHSEGQKKMKNNTLYPDLFSYAFVRSNFRDANFSYTVEMNRL